MKKKNLVRKKQLYTTEIETLCSATAIINELFMFSEVEENQMQFVELLNGLSELLHDVTNNNNQYIEKVPLKSGKERE